MFVGLTEVILTHEAALLRVKISVQKKFSEFVVWYGGELMIVGLTEVRMNRVSMFVFTLIPQETS
jgi:hypothetical protein